MKLHSSSRVPSAARLYTWNLLQGFGSERVDSHVYSHAGRPQAPRQRVCLRDYRRRRWVLHTYRTVFPHRGILSGQNYWCGNAGVNEGASTGAEWKYGRSGDERLLRRWRSYRGKFVWWFYVCIRCMNHITTTSVWSFVSIGGRSSFFRHRFYRRASDSLSSTTCASKDGDVKCLSKKRRQWTVILQRSKAWKAIILGNIEVETWTGARMCEARKAV